MITAVMAIHCAMWRTLGIEHRDRLRGGEDPGQLPRRRGLVVAAGESPEPDRDGGEHVDGEVRDQAQKGQHALDRPDPDRHAKPVLAQVSARLGAGGFERVRTAGHAERNATTQVSAIQIAPSASSRGRGALRGVAVGRRGRRPAGPAPLTSARNAPSSSRSAASGEPARSFGGRRRQVGVPAGRGDRRARRAAPLVEAVLAVEAPVDLGRRRLVSRRAGRSRSTV